MAVLNNLPVSYTLNFWGDLLSLPNTLGGALLSDLDLTAFDHSYTSDNIKDGLTTSLLNGSIRYNLFAKKQYYYNDEGELKGTHSVHPRCHEHRRKLLL